MLPLPHADLQLGAEGSGFCSLETQGCLEREHRGPEEARGRCDKPADGGREAQTGSEELSLHCDFLC